MPHKKTNNDATANKKLIYLEGIRGVAAIMVVIHHYFLAFYPAQASGNPSQAHSLTVELWYYHSPFIFLTNGLYFVFIFFVLSGFVLSRAFLSTSTLSSIQSAFVRRFPRLYLPVAVSLIIAFVLIKCSLNYNAQLSQVTGSKWLVFYNGSSSIWVFLKTLAFRAMFLTDNSYNTVLWTISAELYGSLLVFGLLALTHNLKNTIYIFLIIFFIFFLTEKFEYCEFILGMMLNYTNKIRLPTGNLRRLVVILALLTGLFLGGFPNVNYLTSPTLKGTIYQFFDHNALIKRSAMINGMGAFLIIMAVMKSITLQKVFSVRILQHLGNVSFSMYLIHILVLQSFSAYLFLKLRVVIGYNLAFVADALLSIAIIGILSYIMTIYVDQKGVILSKKIYANFFIENTPSKLANIAE
jgi:peptidoglycan/LPS O-acetylase OafA/YrhL